MAQLLVSALCLDDINAADIDPEASLFGAGASSLGLDSIDALEIALFVKQKYGVELQADDRNSQQIFSSVRALSAHVQGQREV